MSAAAQFIVAFTLGGVVTGAPVTTLLRRASRQLAEATSLRHAETAAANERERSLAGRLSETERQLAGTASELRAVRDAAAEQLELVERAAARVDDRLQASMGEAIERGTGQLLKLASERSARERAEDEARRDRERHCLDGLVGPLSAGLQRLEARLGSLEHERHKAQASLRGELEQLGRANEKLLAGTSALVGALRRPQVRGRWGEATLRNVVEAAGMLKHVDFVEQSVIAGSDGPLRPDMVVRLPGQRRVVVDSKVPLDAFLDAQQAETEEARATHLKRHAKQLAAHLQQLNSKSYWESLSGSPELVFAFIPNDQVYLAAIDADPDLVRRTAADRVVVATPMTLIALLKLAGFGWRQEQITRNAEEVLQAARQVHGRLTTFAEHLAKHGRQLEGSLASWNRVVASYESRLMPTASRMVELGVIEQTTTSNPSPKAIEARPRPVAAAGERGKESA